METYKESGLKPELIKAVTDLGFETPTPIQKECISLLLEEEGDLIGLAQTGTGKTAAFSLPVLNYLEENTPEVTALILSPTRELCLQIAEDVENYSKYLKGIKSVAVYGGTPIDKQIRSLKKGAQVVIGTPGRTLDLIRRKKLDISAIEWLVLDEADEMLTMGFKEDLDEILSTTPQTKNTLLFSATLAPEIRRIAKKYMDQPKEVKVTVEGRSTDNVSHEFYLAHPRDRYAALKRVVDINPEIYSIIFCRTRRETKEVAEHLGQDGYNADALHGDLSQAQRDYVMDRFRKKQLQILVATDVAARGIDVNSLTHVINYNLPDSDDTYTHRSGRTGRASNKGVCMTIITGKEKRRIRGLERHIGKNIEQKQIPNGTEICENQLIHLVDKIENIEINESQIDKFIPEIITRFESLDREELIKRFVSVEFNRFLDYYKNAQDLNEKASSGGRDRGDRPSRRKDGVKYTRLFINLGRKDKLSIVNLIGLINDYSNAPGVEIGDIDLKDTFSFFEIDSDFSDTVIDSMSGQKHRGRNISVEVSERKPSRGGSGGGNRHRGGGGGGRNRGGRRPRR